MWKYLFVSFPDFLFFLCFCLSTYFSSDNVARSLSLVFNVIFTYLILGKYTHWQLIATLSIVILGFFLGIEGELNFSLIGTASGVISSVFVSLNSIYTSKILPVVNNDKSLLLFYNNLNACILFMPLIFMMETGVIILKLLFIESYFNFILHFLFLDYIHSFSQGVFHVFLDLYDY
jgi:hypothetical protein